MINRFLQLRQRKIAVRNCSSANNIHFLELDTTTATTTTTTAATAIATAQLPRRVIINNSNTTVNTNNNVNHNNSNNRMESNLAAIMMGYVLVFLICHLPRLLLNIHELATIRYVAVNISKRKFVDRGLKQSH